jgi:hypothetical protein
VLAIVPACSQYIWEKLLRLYNLEGLPYNSQARADLLHRLILLPKYIFSNFWEYGTLASRHIIKLVVENPILAEADPVEVQCEYWFVLGMLGVFSFFVFMPRYVGKEQREGLYVCYISNLGISFLSSLAATIPPLMRYHTIFLSIGRTNNAYPVLILAQSIGIYHIMKICCEKLEIGNRTEMVVVAVAVFIYILSFVKMLFL